MARPTSKQQSAGLGIKLKQKSIVQPLWRLNAMQLLLAVR
jgi:hypothetical protein